MAFRPVVSERCVRDEVSAKRLERWRRIVMEAAEQSGRGRIPNLTASIPFVQAIQEVANRGLSIIPDEQEHAQSLHALLKNNQGAQIVNLFIGPEGGFSADEMQVAERHHITPVTLGPRILRAETAGLVAATVILYELGEME